MRVTTIKRISFLLVTIIIILIIPEKILAFGVRPLVLDLNLRPGETRDFEIRLMPDNRNEIIMLSFYQPIQAIDGNLVYQEPNPDTFPAINWVQLDNYEAKVYPGEDTIISGKVKVPFDAGGSHTVIIMTEPKIEPDQPGITLVVRYAIRLNIRVDRPGLKANAKLLDFDMVPGESKEPIIKTHIENPSLWDYLVSGEATIRDEERRLIERIDLKSNAAARAGSKQTRMYPGSEVEYTGLLTKRITPGKYTVRVFFRYGEHGQIIQNKTIEVKEDQFSFPELGKIGAFSVEPKIIDLKLKAGQQKSQAFQITSEIPETSIIVLGGSDIEPEYPYSPLSWVELKTPGQFELAGRDKGRIITTIMVPRDTPDADYNGYFILKAYSPETKELLTEKTIPFSILVGDNHICEVEIKSFHWIYTDEGYILSLDIKNTGTIRLTPKADILITNLLGEFIDRLTLTASETDLKTLPLQKQHLDGLIKGLSPGTYLAEIVVYDSQKEILRTSVEMEVPE